MEKVGEAGERFINGDKAETLVEIVEKHLGKGKKVSDCTKSQVEVVSIIYDDFIDTLEELGL
jgi:hypothetical protein